MKKKKKDSPHPHNNYFLCNDYHTEICWFSLMNFPNMCSSHSGWENFCWGRLRGLSFSMSCFHLWLNGVYLQPQPQKGGRRCEGRKKRGLILILLRQKACYLMLIPHKLAFLSFALCAPCSTSSSSTGSCLLSSPACS